MRWRRGERSKTSQESISIDGPIADWLKVAEPLRLCGQISVLTRSGEDRTSVLEDLEQAESTLRIRLKNEDLQTARSIWEVTQQLLNELRAGLVLPLPVDQRAEQAVLCWAMQVCDGMPVKEVGRALSTDNTLLVDPWKAGDKTVRERMWLSGSMTPTNVTMTALPGLVAITEAWRDRFSVDLAHLSPMTARVEMDKVEPEPRPIEGDKVEWVRDVTIPDDSLIGTGQSFRKIWEVRNAGTVPWRGRYLTRIGTSNSTYTLASPLRVEVPDADPGELVQITVDLVAPSTPGTKQVHWKQTDEQGREYFPGPQYTYGIYCRVVVVDNDGKDLPTS